ncbi:MAG TPA: polyphosphate kinase 2 family protein [Leucothrix sp.]|nr:polyphosphate kinase 2 family protein [Leucothrix sp.]HIQ14915.1 polyphosphate kinase 2 family protein [Leucothrix sp.]
MIKALETPFLIKPKSNFKIANAETTPAESAKNKPIKSLLKKELKQLRREIGKLQHQLFAEDKNSLLLIFQAMDAAGKDSTIRAVLSGVNPAGCHVSSFKKPSAEELDHDFLWRSAIRLPERGRIGVFNRSYYEETLVVRVHPNYLRYQRLADLPADLSEGNMQDFWEQRFESIRDHEKHLVRNGTTIIKFWLNVSLDEQKRRFLSRLNAPEKNWKFSADDLKERALWDDYMKAYEETINATSTESAPWYAIPADNKAFMRVEVARTILETLKTMSPQYPTVDEKELAKFSEMRQLLKKENN